MAKSFPFESKNLGTSTSPDWDRAITAQDERDFNKLCWANGVFSNPVTGLLVTAGNGRDVKIKPGGAHIEGARFWENSERQLTLSEASSTLPRIDRIVLRFDTSDDKRNIDIYLKEGVPATYPSPQDIIRQSNYYELVLADIRVPAGATEITNACITDQRANPDLCGMVLPAIPFEKQSEDLWKQLKDGVSLVESALDGTTAGTLNNRISTVEADLDSKITNVKRDVTSTKSDVVDVQNDLEQIAKKLGKDWIIETSTIDGWTVEKWQSGKMVQRLYKGKDLAGWSDVPYMPNAKTSAKTYTFPVPFKDVPMALASATGGSGIGMGVTTHNSATGTTLHVTGSQSCTANGGYAISILAIGKWK